MKILHIGKYFPPYAGGMENYLRDLMAAQQRQSLTPTALVHQSNPGFTSASEEYPVDNQTLHVTRAAVWVRMLFTPISPTFPWLLYRLIRREQPDILHLHMPNVSAFWCLLLPSARRLPWVVHWHSDVLASAHSRGLRLFYRLYRPFEHAILRRCDAVIATSPPYLETSEPLVSYRDKCHVVPLGIEPAVARGDAKAYEGAEEVKQPAYQSTLTVLAVGRLTYYKGFQTLIQAAARDNRIQVSIVGEGEQKEELLTLAAKLGVSQRVTLRGKLSPAELSEAYQNCDCVCLPSIERTEAFGLVLLEAMSYCKPCVVSKLKGSGMSWVVNNLETGFHFEPGSDESLVQCLIQFIENRDNIRLFGDAGARKFNRQFNINTSSSKITNIYAAITENRPKDGK